MKSTTKIYRQDNDIFKGMEETYKIVSSTLGAGGKNVLIRNEDGNIFSTKDGVTVAKNIDFDNYKKSLGSQILLNGANKVNTLTGDGTTTTTILIYNLIDYIRKNKEDVNVSKLSKWIDAYKEKIINEIYSRRVEITKDNNLLEYVATISANNDKNLGKLISMAFERIGNDGTIIIDKNYKDTDTLEIVNGMKLNGGLITSAFLTNNSLKIDFENPYYVIYDGEINNEKEIIHILEYLAHGKESRPIVFIANNISARPLAIMVLNNGRGNLKIAAVKLNYYYGDRSEALKDIAMMTGGAYITKEIGLNPENLRRAFGSYEKIFGKSNRFIADMNEITIIEGHGNVEAIKEKIKELKNELSNPDLPEIKKERISKRIGSLLNKVAYIKLGGHTSFEIDEKKYRAEDALNTTKQALKSGIVKGGGITYKEIVEILQKKWLKDVKEKEQEIALKAFIYALSKPFEILIQNINENPEIIWYEVKRKKKVDGYDVKNKKFVNMIDAGIIDATEVLTTEIDVSADITKIFILNDYIIDKYINENE